MPPRVDAALIVAAGLLLFGLNVDFMLRGDAAMYAEYALQGKFDELTLHIGYYLLVFAADRTVGTLLGVPVHETMVWLNVVAGALTLGVSYHLAREFLGSRRDALICTLIVALCGRVVWNATTSEIYMVQTLATLWSFLLFVRGRVLAAGLLAGFALLVSPLSIFAFAFYPVFDYLRAGRIRIDVWLKLAGACCIVYLPYLAVFGGELLWGRRGLLVISANHPIDAAELLSNFPRFQFKHYTFLLLLLPPALFALRQHVRLLAVTLAVAVPHLYVVLKLPSEDNVFILTTDFFFACWLAVGWRVLARGIPGAWLAPLAPVAHVALLVASGVVFSFDFNRSYGSELRSMAQTYIGGRDAALVSDWDGVMSFTYFGRDSVSTTIERESLWNQMVDVGADSIRTHALDVSEIYLLETWSPGGLRELLSSDSAIAQTREAWSVRAQARDRLGIECSLLVDAIHPLYRCHRRPAAR